MTPVEQLKARFAYMFLGRPVSMEYYDGWFPVFMEACEQIDEVLGENKRDFHWVQVKEKFGSARFYFHIGTSKRLVIDVQGGEEGRALIKTATKGGDTVADHIDAIVEAAEARTQTMCIVCGKEAQTQSYDGYYRTLCALHAPQPAHS